MDPLHPLVPIQPAPPVPPDYTRVQPIERDQQRESEPDWQRSPEEEDEEQRDEQFEDDYDPDWSETPAEAYNDHGELTESPGTSEPDPDAHRPWNPRLQADRRARPRPSEDPEDEEPGPHIDIIA